MPVDSLFINRCLQVLAKCPINRGVIIEATELSGGVLENLWRKGVEVTSYCNFVKIFDSSYLRMFCVFQVRVGLLVLLYRLSGYRLNATDLLDLDSPAQQTLNSDTILPPGPSQRPDVATAKIEEPSVVTVAVGALVHLLRVRDLEAPLYAAAAATLSGKMSIKC